MKLLETEAKQVFSTYGIRTPRGFSVQQNGKIPDHEAYSGYVIKPLGMKGRGKLGLIGFVDNNEGVQAKITEITAKIEQKDKPDFIVEEKVQLQKEYYVSITIDYALRRPVLIISSDGGVEIEHVAKTSPEKIRKLPIDITVGLQKEQVLKELSALSISDTSRFYEVIEKVYKIFREYYADTVEINPLALTASGELIALDAVMSLDDDALYKHPDLEKLNKERKYKNDYEREMGEQGWSYVELDGNIGMISSGAGLSMATLDMIQLHGGKPANFLDMAQVDDKGIARGLEILAKKESIKVIFVNLVAGLNRCDSMAEGVKQFVQKNGLKTPIVVRMVGNMSDEGTKVLKEVGLDNTMSLEKAVDLAVSESKK